MQRQSDVVDVFFDKQTVFVHWAGESAPDPSLFNRALAPTKVSLGASSSAPASLF